MNNTVMNQEDLISENLRVTHSLLVLLKDISKWSRFLSVIGFGVTVMVTILALMLPTLLFSYGNFSAMLPTGYSATGIMVNMLIIAFLIFIPSLFLFQFSTRLRSAIAHDQQDLFEASFHYLKSTFRFYGILAILLMGLYLLIFLTLAFSGM